VNHPERLSNSLAGVAVGPVVRAAAWGALGVGLLNAAVSAYWALGGTAGLNTIGGQIEEMARAREPSALAVVWAVVAVKIAGAVLGVMLLRAGSLPLASSPAGRHGDRRVRTCPRPPEVASLHWC